MATERKLRDYPTADFFRSSPRSNTIREACLPIAYALDDRVIVEAVISTTPEDELYEPFTRGREILEKLGIVPGMHEDEGSARRNADPIIFAEHIAGRLIMLDEVRLRSISMSGMTERIAFWALNSLGVPVDRRLDPINDR